MVVEISELNLPSIYPEVLQRLMIEGKSEETRNGEVLTFEDPFFLTMINPDERVIFDPIRDANPFFHLMEFVWMMSGSQDVNWIAQFNKRYYTYADDGIIHGAYGHRWINHFNVNQILKVINLLKTDRKTRRAVLGMWDPAVDLEPHNDLPCNTHIYFRPDDDGLDMTVCNRSNDIIWGMLGANVVHMTLLQELIALGAGLKLGVYRVLSNNAHVYKGVPKYDEIMQTLRTYDPYSDGKVDAFPLLQEGEMVEEFLLDCYQLVHSPHTTKRAYRTTWVNAVAGPMHEFWFTREARWMDMIVATDWRMTCSEWMERRSLSSTSTGR